MAVQRVAKLTVFTRWAFYRTHDRPSHYGVLIVRAVKCPSTYIPDSVVSGEPLHRTQDRPSHYSVFIVRAVKCPSTYIPDSVVSEEPLHRTHDRPSHSGVLIVRAVNGVCLKTLPNS